MRGNRKTAVLLCLFAFSVMLSACGWKDRGKTIADDDVTPVITEEPVSPTPFPFRAPEPVYRDVSADAYPVVPQFSGSEDSVWQYAVRIPIEKSLRGTADTSAEFQVFYEKKALYVRLSVSDKTKTINNTVTTSDHAVFFINECGDRPKKYSAGDAYFTVLRDGRIVYGPGCDTENLKAFGYETEDGYVIEVKIPFTFETAETGATVGLDIRVNDYDGTKIVRQLQWSDTSGRTETTLQNIGTIVLGDDKASALPQITVDGEKEVFWNLTDATKIANCAFGSEETEATFRMLWGNSLLYLLIEVKDDTKDTDAQLITRKDSVEVFFCGDDSKPEAYREGKDLYVRIARDGTIEYGTGASEQSVLYRISDREDGYVIEMSVLVPEDVCKRGNLIGLDIHVNDSHGEGKRDTVMVWSDTSLNTFSDLSRVGTVVLK